ncbi:MAG: sigma factor-like helix-turn-helix DNA-binding protein [Candidatus Liptonbacteria bacterium]
MLTTSQIINTINSGLSPREKEVITGRFGLDKSGKAQTLAALGNKYGVTRERVRQIESGALKTIRRNIQNSTEIAVLLEKSKKMLRDAGGAIVKEKLVELLQDQVSGIGEQLLAVIIEASKSFFVYPENKNSREFYYLDKSQLKKSQTFLKQWSQALNFKKEHVLSGKYQTLLEDFISKKGFSKEHAENMLATSKEFALNPYGDTGLAEWPEIRPKTIRDRVYLVLKKRGEPLHFRTIARAINEIKFDAKKASAPTVHNELIKDARFVLVGRGMYALAEHGYVSGTAKEVIHRILKKQGPLTARQVVLAVQKERFFKPNTVLVNLQNKNYFAHLHDGTYHVRES